VGWGEFFALSSALVWALAVILFRRSGETLPAFELNLFKNLFGLVLMIPTILLVDGLCAGMKVSPGVKGFPGSIPGRIS